ncbi:endonuclease/exonuclease/phosphatase family protein [Ceratobasidium sp. AG-Ba]|nr:endonuclease/exonuclease/phosphatase family protein [Ceratobasidium sp. AG-Ba]
METTIEDNSIKPVNKLRERFEALAASSSSNKTGASQSSHDHEDEPQPTQEAMGASPRLSGLYNLRSVSASASSIPNASTVLKKSSESDTSNEEVSTLVNEISPSTRPGSPTVGRKPGLKPPPPPPPDRSAILRNKASTDSVGSAKKSIPALGVYRKPPPPPPSTGSQPGHVASLSVGDLVNQINVSNMPSFRSLDTSPITTPATLHPLNGFRRSPSPAPPEIANALPPRPVPPPIPPMHPIRINIPDSAPPQAAQGGSETGSLPRSPMKPVPPPRAPAQLTFTPSTPSTPAPRLPSRTSPDQHSMRNAVIHHSLTKQPDGLVASEADEFGVDIRSPPPRHHSLTSRPPSSTLGKPGAPPPPPPPRPTSLISPVSNSSPSIITTGSLIHAPPPLPNRRSNPNLRAEDSPPTPIITPSTSAPPAPPVGDKLPPARRHSGDESSDDSEDDGHSAAGPSMPAGKKYHDDMPDSSQSRRQPPKLPQYPYFHISTGAVVAVSGAWVCVGNLDIGVYNTQNSSAAVHMIDLEHMGLEWRTKEPRVTAMEFRPVENPEDDGRYLWCGTKDGHLFELDIQAGTLMEVLIPAGGHSLTVTHIIRYGRSMFTMDESGKVIVFDPPEGHPTPTLSRFTRSHRVADKQSFVRVLAGHLWTSSGSGSTSSTHTTRGPPFRTYDISSSSFATKHLFPNEQVGPALCGAVIPQRPDRVYIGHEGGSVTVWKYDASSSQYACVQTVKVTNSSIICMEGVDSRLWFGTRSGTITVCEAREELPWVITNQWQAHGDSPVMHISVDPYSITQVGKLVVYSVGRDDCLKFWDGLLEWNWIDEEMQKRETQYSTYRDIKVRICTWNIDSQKPDTLSGNEDNRNFFDNMLKSGDRPDIIVFGFQEVIDLENKKLTAKTVLLGGQKSKTEGKISEKVSRSYKLWYDKLVYHVRLAFGGEEPYNVIHSENLVGLFTCIFVRKPECISLSDPSITTVKRGMKGRYGNKGAIIARFVLDDTSFCFLNCHLAAGQKHVRERNQDLASILEERSVFPTAVHDMAPAAFASGGDGSMVLDHEVVFLNGDLNYRIDQRREIVVSSIQSGDLAFLLGHDQLLKEMQTNPGFRLRSFNEAPITFVPTYKYDRKSNEFDSSEKRRIPAWCDRILYRSRGDHVHCDMYRRYEANISDHRPVAGAFTVQVKSVRREAWSTTKGQVQEEWQQVQYQLLCAAQDFYASNGLLV